MTTSFFSFVFQDSIARFPRTPKWKHLQRYFRIPGFKILAQYRLCQYVRRYGGGRILLPLCRLWLEHTCGKYCVTISDGLEAGPGLCFPHNGPFVISGGCRIGRNCTVHPGVLLAGDRGKGCPTIGDNVFVGHGAKIIGNCHVGSWCFIAPGAVVTKDIPDGTLVGSGVNMILNDQGRKHVEMYL